MARGVVGVVAIARHVRLRASRPFAQLRRVMTIEQYRDGLDPEQTALAFFGPIHLLIQCADGGDDDEQRARELLAGHVRHFRQTHLKEK